MSRFKYLLICFLALCSLGALLSGQARRPNVILILTDDQGWGDVGFHGNKKIHTPTLDRLADQSLELTRFYVSPVCAPTRASLMTGRYNYRTGVVDTYLGRALMHPDERTLAEFLSEGGYRTGIFGKWHLGDNYPLRAMDQGFQESVVHQGGGIGQPSDPPQNSYFDPILQHNGVAKRFSGYCTDIFFEEARNFIAKDPNHPFFAYIATNAPHTPLEIAESYVQPYLNQGLDETTARVYGMITNIDENVARLLRFLEERSLAENTILIFLTDNGPQQARYKEGLRGRKASVYEGGIRVPFLVRWPNRIPAGAKSSRLSAHIDLLPTLLDLCGIPRPYDRSIDGRSLSSHWLEPDKEQEWPERLLFIQSHRGDAPEFGRAAAVISRRFKLVQAEGWSEDSEIADAEWQLFDLAADPGESVDLAGVQKETRNLLHEAYRRWFGNAVTRRSTSPPRIVVGSTYENPVTLTRQDWRGARASWGEEGLGHWEISVAVSGRYRVRMRFPPDSRDRTIQLRIGEAGYSAGTNVGAGLQMARRVPAGAEEIDFTLELSQGPTRLTAILSSEERDDGRGVHYVDLFHLN